MCECLLEEESIKKRHFTCSIRAACVAYLFFYPAWTLHFSVVASAAICATFEFISLTLDSSDAGHLLPFPSRRRIISSFFILFSNLFILLECTYNVPTYITYTFLYTIKIHIEKKNERFLFSYVEGCFYKEDNKNFFLSYLMLLTRFCLVLRPCGHCRLTCIYISVSGGEEKKKGGNNEQDILYSPRFPLYIYYIFGAFF